MASRAMKDSRVQWLGYIPNDWKVTKINKVTKSYSGGTPSRQNNSFWEKGVIPWISSGEVNKEYIYDTNEKITTLGLQKSSAKMFPANTVIVALNGQGKTKGMSAIIKIKASTNQSLVGFICDEDRLDYRYLNYLFKSSYEFNRNYYAGGDKRDGIAAGDLKQAYIPLPEKDKQKKIAAFLDGKVDYINNIIEDTKKSIENLKAYKQSLITETVTKGIDPNVEMKDSGIEWIGDIPKHWNPIKLKYLVELRNEKKNYKKGDCYIGLENIESYKGRINSVQIDYNSGLTDFFKKGDVLFNKLRPYLAKGFIAEFDAFGSGELLVLTQYKGDKRFLLYYLLSSKFIDVINSSTYGAKMPRANWDFIKELSIISPTKEEQGKIADFLDEKSRTIDSTIEQKKQLVIELESYKKSLIYEYVTGKKEVK